MELLGLFNKGKVSSIAAISVISLGLFLSGCSKDKAQQGDAATTATPSATASSDAKTQETAQVKTPPPVVYVSPVKTIKKSFSKEWPAETKFGENIDVRARVEGTLKDFSFTEGMGVKQGQVLFTIDDAPYQAKLLSAQAKVSQCKADLSYAMSQVQVKQVKADLASAQASLARAQQDVDRYKPLAQSGVIPTQTLDNAVAQRDVCKAQVDATLAALRNAQLSEKANIEVAQASLAAAEAQVTQAKLDIGYCVITSPINGIIGKLNVDPGNLVGSVGDSKALVTISKMDPMYVNFSITESDYLHVMSHRGGGKVDYTFTMSNGSEYPQHGRFGMLNRAVDSKSGTIGVRIIFPNPSYVLREGQFGRIKMTTRNTYDVMVVPQRAVTTTQSVHSVYVVGHNNVVEVRNVEIGSPIDENYEVKSGLKVGDVVIVDGIQKVKPGVVCEPEDHTAGQTTSDTGASALTESK